MRKNDSTKRLIILALSLIGLCVLTAFYSYGWFHYFYQHIYHRTGNKFNVNGHYLIIGIYFVLLFFFSNTYGALKIGYLKPVDIFLSQLFALLCVNVISYCQLCLMYGWFILGGEKMITMTILQLLFSAVWTWLCNVIYRKAFPPRQLLLIHGERPIEDILNKFASRQDKYRVARCMNISEGYDAIKKAVVDYDAIVLWDIHTADRNELLKYCYSRSIRVYMMPKIPDVIVKGSSQLHLFDTPILLTREYALNVEQRIVKRLIDVICALILLVIASPFMLVTAIAIKLYDGGPVLYKQVRCTRDAREFEIMKFRSMRVDAEKDGVARLAAKNDSRITPIGKFIRAVRIDELPQLINILKGEMSFIGPRPERPQIIAQYMEEMPEFAFRMKVKAGLAGYAQVYGKYNTTPYDKLKLDLFYIENYSVWLDIKLMLLTVKILFSPDSTEGVDAKQVTALKKQVEEQEK
ncbi:MAG: sugar transferase [Lachnospiraceae bacterium]|nr:sugar transferase [Lachnospiraceae bacterium]